MKGSVLVLELNELCPPLLERFMTAGDLPNISRMYAESAVFTTDADEPDGPLNPWVQWVTAHTGVGYDEHQVLKLGEGAGLQVPTIGDEVGDAGGQVWLCAPMNVVPTKPVRGVWLPDPWNPEPANVPAAMEPFAAFVRANVQEHTNVARKLSPVMAARFLWFMVRHGLSLATAREVVAQLVGERTGKRARWRRAALLDRFQWDVFTHRYRRTRPELATYFSNTTAHYQHVYWRYMDPEPFSLKPTSEEVATFGGAIRSGYLEMDRLVGQAMDLAGPETTVVLCTALSQQPYAHQDDVGGKRFYRPRDITSLVAALRIPAVNRVAPVMSEQFHLYFGSESDAELAAAALSEATVAGVPAFDVRRVVNDVFTGFSITADLPEGAEIEVPATGARVAVDDHLYRAETAKSGHHHPHGALWIRTPERTHHLVDAPVSLRAVAPTLLDLIGIESPRSMQVPALRVTAS